MHTDLPLPAFSCVQKSIFVFFDKFSKIKENPWAFLDPEKLHLRKNRISLFRKIRGNYKKVRWASVSYCMLFVSSLKFMSFVDSEKLH